MNCRKRIVILISTMVVLGLVILLIWYNIVDSNHSLNSTNRENEELEITNLKLILNNGSYNIILNATASKNYVLITNIEYGSSPFSYIISASPSPPINISPWSSVIINITVYDEYLDYVLPHWYDSPTIKLKTYRRFISLGLAHENLTIYYKTMNGEYRSTKIDLTSKVIEYIRSHYGTPYDYHVSCLDPIGGTVIDHLVENHTIHVYKIRAQIVEEKNNRMLSDRIIYVNYTLAPHSEIKKQFILYTPIPSRQKLILKVYVYSEEGVVRFASTQI